MSTVHRAATATSLALTSLFAALPVGTQMYHPHPYHHANRLDRRANHAAMNGNFGRAARLRSHADRIRCRTYFHRHIL